MRLNSESLGKHLAISSMILSVTPMLEEQDPSSSLMVNSDKSGHFCARFKRSLPVKLLPTLKPTESEVSFAKHEAEANI